MESFGGVSAEFVGEGAFAREGGAGGFSEEGDLGFVILWF